MTRTESKRKYGSAAGRAKAAAAVAGPGGGGGTMFQNIPQGIEFYKPEEGKVTLRLLPYIVKDPKHPDGEMAPVGDIWYKRPFKRFRSIGTEKKPYVSPKSVGLPCPIMEYYTAAKADPSIPDKDANKAKPQDVVMYNVQVQDKRSKEWSEPMFFFFSYHNFEKMLKKELLDPDNEEYLAFMDLEGGFDIRVRWEKESFDGNDFLKAGSISFIERDDLDESILDEVVDLDSVLVVKSYKELQNIFLEIDDEETNDNEDAPEKEKPRAPARTRKSAEPEKEAEPEKQTRRSRGEAKKEEPEPEPEKTTQRSRNKPAPEPEPEEPEENKCPHGFVFGDDFDTKRKCEKCEVFDECGDQFDADHPAKDEKKKDAKAEKSEKSIGKSSKSDSKNECPSGHIFGTDCDKKPECNDCPKWDACMDRQEEL